MRFFYISVFLVLIGALIFLVLFMVTQKPVSDKYLPFASIPEIELSENAFNTINEIVSKALKKPVKEEDVPMITGKYQRYPLSRDMQPTSIVAVNAGIDNNFLAAWHMQVGVNGFNILWPDTTSAYWVSLINVKESPVAVLKGQFPFSRYFSIYSYVGIDRDAVKQFGTGLTKFSADSDDITQCNPTAHNCAGLHDVEIKPDKGSKNPFTDPTFNPDVDSAYYTIFFISPYYKGQLPKSNNIFLPMTSSSSEQCLICLRIYAPFNPKFCGSSYYSSIKSFTTEGCPSMEGVRTYLDGGPVDPATNDISPCSTTDNTCIKAGVNFQSGKDLKKDCYQYVGNNQYCVCTDEKPTTACGRYLDRQMLKYSNNKASLADYCNGAPSLAPGMSYCIDEIVLADGTKGRKVTTDTVCDPNDNKCAYVKQGRVQQCVAEKLYTSTNPACAPFKNPQTLLTINQGENDCQEEFASYIRECDKSLAEVPTPVILDAYVKNSPPPYNYQPEYDFETCPLDCESKCGTYTCSNGYCVPKIGGEYTSADCDQQCEKGCETEAPLTEKYSCKKIQKGRHCILDKNGKFDSLEDCQKKCSSKMKESFENPICSSNIGDQVCEPNKRKYTDINNYYANSQEASLLFDSGWVGLPDVFLKYSFNDYFVRLNNYRNSANYNKILANDVKGVKRTFDFKNINNPSDVFLVKNENPSINMREYVDSLEGFKMSEEKKDENKCPDYVDPSTYFTIGTQYAAPSIKNRNNTKMVPPPGCSYYKDICDCESYFKNSKMITPPGKTPPQCGLQGVLKIDGSSCFHKWSLTLPSLCSMKAKENCKSNTKYKFSGDANPFFISPNVSDVIIFPNPDTDYMGAFTEYNDKYVYVIWMDVPSAPVTPGYDNIMKNDYQTRYWSIGHYSYGFSLTSPRPVLSSLMDFETNYKDVEYQDQKTKANIKGKRVCVVVASTEQYNYLKTYELWKDKPLSWLNWGASSSKLLSTFQKLKKRRNAAYDELKNYMESDFDSSSAEIDMLYNLAQKYDLDDSVMAPKNKYGILLYRQMLPSSDLFTKSISSYVNTIPSCLNKQIELKNEKYLFSPKDEGIKSPVYISKSCNPGPSLCTSTVDGKDVTEPCADKYDLDPCCVATEPLDYMEQYYPRCERVKICDIEQMGQSFWDRYLNYPLPYAYE